MVSTAGLRNARACNVLSLLPTPRLNAATSTISASLHRIWSGPLKVNMSLDSDEVLFYT